MDVIMNPKKLAILERNFELYWSGREPEISDQRFDQLVEELRKENPDHPFLKKVGIAVQRGTKYVHKKAMLSLDKVYEFKDLEKWIKNVARTPDEEFDIQFKFDGLAGKYSNGILATRGDGQVGEDISRRKANIYLVQDIYTIPLIEYSRKEDIIGEIVVSYKKFEKYKKSLERDFSNPRNFVAGMINRKEALPFNVKLDFVEYKSSFTRRLKASEFDVRRWYQIIQEFDAKKVYPTDGLVIKLHDTEYADSLGYTEHHPKGSIAFKFYGTTAWTTLLDVIWSPGKGSLTPVAIIKPVVIGDVKISKVTMHNAKFVMDKDIHIGDELEIERAGEVIPHVVSARPGDERKHCIPAWCPVCHEKLVYEEPELKCKNPECKGTRLQLMKSSLECFEIDGLGETIINALWALRFLDTPADIFRLTKEQLLQIPRFGERSAEKLYQSIQDARSMTVATILASLNTPGVGKSLYQKILTRIMFYDLINNPTRELFVGMPDIGETRTVAIIKSIRKNRTYIQDMLSLVKLKIETPTSGKTVCFTGAMDKPRSYYQKMAKDKGWNPVDSVSKTLDVLVVPDRSWTSSKTKNAEKFGVKILTLEEWLENE